MRSEEEIRQAIAYFKREDARCPADAHKEGRPCADAGHAIYGTYLVVLRWVLGEGRELW